MHYLRSPSEHFYFLCSLLDIKNFFGNLNLDLPNGLNERIKEMKLILDFFVIGDGHLAIFNKYDFISSNKIYNLQKKLVTNIDFLVCQNALVLIECQKIN